LADLPVRRSAQGELVNINVDVNTAAAVDHMKQVALAGGEPKHPADVVKGAAQGALILPRSEFLIPYGGKVKLYVFKGCVTVP